MTDKELKLAIQKAIIDFSKSPVYQASLNLFKTLGYNTERQNPLPHKSYDDFKDSFLGTDSPFNEEKSCVKEWKSIDLLFQLTADEVSSQRSLFNTRQVDNTIIETYLFFSIELTKAEYNRTQLAQITREINKVFPMPVLIVFKHGESITLSVINRQLNKKDAQKDVLEKVTVIKDISTTSPHRAHIEMLFDLSFAELQRVHKFSNFVELHNAWQKTLDTKELNKRFYRDLSNWYFWARRHVRFPNEPTIEQIFKSYGKLDDDILKIKINEHKSLNLIRMLTRLLFIWFIKEKGLIPEELFDLKSLQQKILNKIEPTRTEGLFTEANKDSVFYKAILQNLFFAVLNCPISEKDKLDKRKRGFSKNNFGVLYLMRYESYFKDSNYFLDLMNSCVPFLNGGLFDCLDIRGEKEKKDERVYIDGFSDNLPEQHQLIVPDYIFFGTGEHDDLSEELGDKKQKDVSVNGLMNILKSYKFTVTENTPIEEDIALDPELLGRVFENLLASYNPETKTTARKQTGSFYTPREIVNYMVDESLKAYLKQKLEAEAGMKPEDAEVGLEFLVGYNEKTHLFDDKQTAVLINAIDNCKILDPACGSGAFPMGILHKLVHILHKLDPNNKLWKERQIEKAQTIDDSEIRDKLIEDIETSFESNELDYGRKLYLIENCIYGVDIQPIATQISKLRFFISLIVEQKSNKNKENFGIRPLPNLETKFVAANTLIGIEKPDGFLRNIELDKVEQKLKDVRHRLFSAKTPATKRKLREEDQRIREEMGALLVQSGWGNESAHQLAAWDPYNQNVSSGWFDPEWMFGLIHGFDVIIGNPPYIGHKGGLKHLFRELKSTTLGKKFNNERMDIFYYFFHASLDLANSNGVISFITTNYYLTADSAIKLRTDFKTRARIFKLLNFNEMKVFESAMGQHNIVTFLSKNINVTNCEIINISRQGVVDSSVLDRILLNEDESTSYYTIESSKLFDSDKFYIRLSYGCSSEIFSNDLILDKIRDNHKLLGDYCNISQGIVTGIDKISPKHVLRHPEFEDYKGCGVFVLSSDEKKYVGKSPLLKPWFKNSDIARYFVKETPEKWLIHTSSEVNLKEYENIEKHLNIYKNIILERNYESGELSKAKRLKRWWALSSSRWEFDFDKPKIVSPQRSYNNTFAFTAECWYASADVYFISEKQLSIPLKYFLGILNSKLIYYWLYNRGKRKGEMLELYLTPLSEIPIAKPNENDINKIVTMVNDIISAKRDDSEINTGKLEKQIDVLVYKLYDLTEEEIAIIESSVK